MKKLLFSTMPVLFALAACAQEAAAPVTDDDLQDENMPVEVMPNDAMPEGEVQEAPADSQFDQQLSEEDANAALDALDAEEAEKTTE